MVATLTSELEKIIQQIQAYDPQADTGLVKKAYEFAFQAHQGQQRLSGEEYISHPLEVAQILVELQLDVITIAASLLHDVVEDAAVSLELVEREFGQEVAFLVDGVTKLKRLSFSTQEEQQVEYLRKMFLAMAKDVRVILIKLADRLHNMRTLKHQPGSKQKEIARETMDIFAPLAHRLGIFRIKWELEDLALRYLEPDRYYDIVNSISMKRKEREEYITQVIDILTEKLQEVGVEADIQGRPKHFYSIYNKMVKQDRELSEIYDLIAVRVIVDSVRDCYGVLGMVHTLWKPIPGRFKDYVAMPKPNMYQSLHTTVLGPQGEPFEVQIRTWEMHRTAEYGIAAHWKYKGIKEDDKDFDKKLTWLRQLLDWQRETRDAREFMESLKVDLFSDRVYVFTPKGDVVELPAGANPLDFAYKVHTMVGHQCVGAKINGRIVPLDYSLKTGDIVEILTNKNSGPSRDWLGMAHTSQAKNRIRQWFKKEEREENIIRGRELLEKEIKKQGLESEAIKNDRWLELGKRYKIQTLDELYAALGEGALSPVQLVGRLKEELSKYDEKVRMLSTLKPFKGYGKASQGIRVKGIDNVMVRLSRCCNPLPGDEIVGYITRGRGVSIHRTDCPNIGHYEEAEKHRLIDVIWDAETDALFQVHLEALAVDRPRLTMDIITAVADTKTIINSVHARATKNKLAAINLKIEIRGMDHLHYIMEKIRKINDVLEVKRVTNY